MVAGTVLGVVLLVLPVPVAPIDDVEPGVVLALPVVVVVSVLVLPVVVLGVVLPLRLPDPVVDPVVVDGVVVVLLDELLSAGASARLQALRDRAAAMATAMAVYWVFIRNSLLVWLESGKGSRSCPGTTLGGQRPGDVGSGSNRV